MLSIMRTTRIGYLSVQLNMKPIGTISQLPSIDFIDIPITTMSFHRLWKLRGNLQNSVTSSNSLPVISQLQNRMKIPPILLIPCFHLNRLLPEENRSYLDWERKFWFHVFRKAERIPVLRLP